MSAVRERAAPGPDVVPRPGRGPRVGMVGAGQLARMTHQAAIDLCVDFQVLAESIEESAVRAGAEYVLGSADDLGALRQVAQGCDAVTFDHELVPRDHVCVLEAEGFPFVPSASVVRLAQDKLHARRTLGEQGFPIPAYAAASTLDEVEAFGTTHGWPLIAKAPCGGYDGRGVWPIADAHAAVPLLARHGELLLEPQLALDAEVAVVAARTADGACAVYPPVETVQRDGMCREVLAPAAITDDLVKQACLLAETIAARHEIVGVFALELFVVDGALLINELALRPHNAGHFTMEGTRTSQFEQHLRAVLGWPLGVTDLAAASVAMVNVIGPPDGSDPVTNLPAALAVPGTHVHLYGKAARPGRKLGHVTACADDRPTAQGRAQRAAAILEGRLA